MRSTRQVPLALILVGVFSACSASDKAMPTSPFSAVVPSPPPSGPASPPQNGPGAGTIVFRELSPAPGTMLTVQSNCPRGDLTRTCTDKWRGIFDVTIDREMTWAVLAVRFYNGQTLCGVGANTLDVVAAASRVSFEVDRIYLSDEFSHLAQSCRLPATTNRIEVELWSDAGTWTNSLIQVFEIAYTFSGP